MIGGKEIDPPVRDKDKCQLRVNDCSIALLPFSDIRKIDRYG